MRAVIDTSSWVSAVLSRSGRIRQIIEAFQAGRFVVVTSEPAFAETAEVLARPDLIVTGTARITARALLDTLRDRADFVALTGQPKLCRDPNDDMVVETALRGEAEVLVAEDKDLLQDPPVLGALAAAGVRVLTAVQFLDELEAGER